MEILVEIFLNIFPEYGAPPLNGPGTTGATVVYLTLSTSTAGQFSILPRQLLRYWCQIDNNIINLTSMLDVSEDILPEVSEITVVTVSVQLVHIMSKRLSLVLTTSEKLVSVYRRVLVVRSVIWELWKNGVEIIFVVVVIPGELVEYFTPSNSDTGEKDGCLDFVILLFAFWCY